MIKVNKEEAIDIANQIVEKIRKAGVRYAKRYSMKTAKNTWKVKLYATDRDVKKTLEKAGVLLFLKRRKITYKVLDEKHGWCWHPVGFTFWIEMLPKHKKETL